MSKFWGKLSWRSVSIKAGLGLITFFAASLVVNIFNINLEEGGGLILSLALLALSVYAAFWVFIFVIFGISQINKIGGTERKESGSGSFWGRFLGFWTIGRCINVSIFTAILLFLGFGPYYSSNTGDLFAIPATFLMFFIVGLITIKFSVPIINKHKRNVAIKELKQLAGLVEIGAIEESTINHKMEKLKKMIIDLS